MSACWTWTNISLGGPVCVTFFFESLVWFCFLPTDFFFQCVWISISTNFQWLMLCLWVSFVVVAKGSFFLTELFSVHSICCVQTKPFILIFCFDVIPFLTTLHCFHLWCSTFSFEISHQLPWMLCSITIRQHNCLLCWDFCPQSACVYFIWTWPCSGCKDTSRMQQNSLKNRSGLSPVTRRTLVCLENFWAQSLLSIFQLPIWSSTHVPQLFTKVWIRNFLTHSSKLACVSPIFHMVS